MMKENTFDGVLAEVTNIVNSVSGFLGTEYKNVKPFNKRKRSVDERLAEYEQYKLNPQKMIDLMGTMGVTQTNQYIGEMEQLLERRRQRNAQILY